MKRIEDGTYGICELTGKPIGWKRLEAIPWTRFSVEAENQLEGYMCPHLGRLDAIRPAEKETYDASDDLANQERVLTADTDLWQTYLPAGPQVWPVNGDGSAGGE